MNYINAVNAAAQQYGDNAFARKSQVAATGAYSADDAALSVQQSASGTRTQDAGDSSAVGASSWAGALAKAKSEQGAEAAQDDGSGKTKQATEAELEKQREQARELTQKLNAQNIGLNFDLDDTYDRMVIKVTNKSTKDLVRQIPSEDLMRFQKVIADFESGDKSDAASQSYGAAGSTQEGLASAIKGLIFDTRA